MADDAAAVLEACGVPSAHVAGFSGGSITAQELALRHPQLVRSLVLQSTWPVMDPYYRSWVRFVQWLVEDAPSERAFLEGFFLDIYTARAHNDGKVDQFIEEVVAFPHKQKAEDLQRYLDPLVDHDTTDRLPEITAPTLVLAGGRDPGARPALRRRVAELIPGARFEVMEEEAHQPFQEVRTSGTPGSTPSGRRWRREAEAAAAQQTRSSWVTPSWTSDRMLARARTKQERDSASASVRTPGGTRAA
jgi:3-oxoadipate enol-lactonase